MDPREKRYPIAVVAYLRAALVVFLALGTNPGVVELMQDGVHLLLGGHDDHGDDVPACPEHGCTPTSHRCGCCTAQQIIASSIATDVPGTSPMTYRWATPAQAVGPRGVGSPLLRPPTA